MTLEEDNRDNVPMFVVDVLRYDDIETINSILFMLNNDGCIGWRDCWSRDFNLQDLEPALRELLAYGFVSAHREMPDCEFINGSEELKWGEFDLHNEADRIWFHLTPTGRAEWKRWKPPRIYGA